MTRFLLPIALLATTTGVAPLLAQQPERLVSPVTVARPRTDAALTPTPKSSPALLRVVGRQLDIGSDANATGLTGYYDYQSNGGSPGYLARYRSPENSGDIYVTTFMNAQDANGVDALNASRRVGYAYSFDGGLTWGRTTSIFDLRLGFPYVQVSNAGIPYIAAHGNLGDGDRAFMFASGEIRGVDDYYPLAELPLRTASGRDGGVAWPSFVLSDARAVVIGSYSNDIDQPEAPLQVATVNIGDGSSEPTWRNLADSMLSNTSGGRALVARSTSGRIGAAWFKHQLDSNDATWGVYYAESTDGGTTWSSAVAVLSGESIIGDLSINGNADTLSAGSNIDLAFRGEEPQIVFTGNLNNLLQFANVLYWSPSTGLKMVALSHSEQGLGAYSIPLEKRQQNMGSIAYPTISVGDDGRHVVVAFSAVSQTIDAGGNMVDNAVSEDGFQYYRIWGVGSADGGRTWGRPFVIQDFAEKATDSASIEYPSALELSKVTAGTLELPIVYQVKRYPGMYAYTGSGDNATDRGPITEASQFFQRFIVTPSMFRSTAAADPETAASTGVSLHPNRASTVSALELQLERASGIDVRIVDALGREVAHPVVDETLNAGRHRIQLDVAGLPAGRYLCVVRHGRGVTTRVLEVVP